MNRLKTGKLKWFKTNELHPVLQLNNVKSCHIKLIISVGFFKLLTQNSTMLPTFSVIRSGKNNIIRCVLLTCIKGLYTPESEFLLTASR